MGHTNCVVCDLCGKHQQLSQTDLFRAQPPGGWVTLHPGDERAQPGLFCSIACVIRYQREGACD